MRWGKKKQESRWIGRICLWRPKTFDQDKSKTAKERKPRTYRRPIIKSHNNHTSSSNTNIPSEDSESNNPNGATRRPTTSATLAAREDLSNGDGFGQVGCDSARLTESQEETSDYRYHCHHCNNSYSDKRGLQRHLDKLEGKLHQCEICLKMFSRHDVYKRHVRLVHGPFCTPEEDNTYWDLTVPLPGKHRPPTKVLHTILSCAISSSSFHVFSADAIFASVSSTSFLDSLWVCGPVGSTPSYAL
ncbi:zinc finger C2H2-type protein [Elysia marginata]|uniref:Zinc finger C2H2-type protein n=1 Tax=Elysia marginata TaxID=1093978 RepID=A0AAV4F725_9GAST|nr:zinc finger C2H2-type protein [Elysia marginata]